MSDLIRSIIAGILLVALGCTDSEYPVSVQANSDSEQTEECDMCRTPSSRATFLKAALAEKKRVANVESITAE